MVCTGLSRSIECRYPNIFVDCGKLLVRAAAAYKNFPPYYSERVGVMQNADTFTSHNALITLFVRSSNEVHITFAYFAIVFLKIYQHFALTDTEEFLWRQNKTQS